MTLTIIIAAVTIIAMITVVLVKPYITVCGHNLGLYWIVCLLGAVLMLICGCITPAAVFDGITAKSSVNPLKILTLFLSMTLLSVYLGDAGFFDYVANTVFVKSKGGQLKLLYWGRYSTGVGFTHEQTLYGFASRNISDVFNFTKNTSLQLAVGKNFKEQETKFLLGVSIRL